VNDQSAVQIWPRSKFEFRKPLSLHGVQKLSSKGAINCTASINTTTVVISVKYMASSSRTYITIPKGRGFLYAHDQKLYKQIKKNNNVPLYVI